jgi:hypothetical protein
LFVAAAVGAAAWGVLTLAKSPCATGRAADFVLAHDLSNLRGGAVPRLPCRRWRGVGDAAALSGSQRQPDDIEAFGVTLAALVDRADPARSLLLNKPTNRERHTGGVRIKPGSFEEQALTGVGAHLATLPDAAVTAARERLRGQRAYRPAIRSCAG